MRAGHTGRFLKIHLGSPERIIESDKDYSRGSCRRYDVRRVRRPAAGTGRGGVAPVNGRQMTRGAALHVILVENDRKNCEPNPAEFRRLLRAFAALDLTTDEQLAACRHLGIANATGRTVNPELFDLAPWRHVEPGSLMARQAVLTKRHQDD